MVKVNLPSLQLNFSRFRIVFPISALPRTICFLVFVLFLPLDYVILFMGKEDCLVCFIFLGGCYSLVSWAKFCDF